MSQGKTISPRTKFDEWLDNTGLKHEPHQKKAVEWCLKRENASENKGGIIADEMGLGKTIEILGTVYSNPMNHTLIVLPYSLLSQWTKIIENIFPGKALVFHGVKRNIFSIDFIKEHPIVLTTYGAVTKKKIEPVIENQLYNIEWDRIIYDEAHHIRNKTTGVNTGVHKLKTAITWLLTGTPIQNSIEDLYSLFELLGFKNRSQYFKKEHVLLEEYMLRRTKEEAGIKLPTCKSEIVNVEWKYPKQQKLAKQIHSRLQFSNIDILDEMLTGSGTLNSYSEITTTHTESPLAIISRAKKMCTIPKIMDGSIIETETESDSGINTNIKTNNKVIEMLCRSSKIESVVNKVLERKKNGRPKLIFCYFHAEIDELARLLRDKGLEVKKLDGRTSKKERISILESPCEVLIGQIDATNEGLNLQSYKDIYIVSPHWNPAIEDQAIARCHRIGQTEEVCVFHFQMNGFDGYEKLEKHGLPIPKALTLDQYICKVQEIKRNIVKKAFGLESCNLEKDKKIKKTLQKQEKTKKKKKIFLII